MSHTSQYAVQQDLFGGQAIVGNIVDKLTWILEQHPAARQDYKLAMYYYWLEFDGLAEILDGKADAFKQWLIDNATSPKTLQNRCMEIQNKHPDLEAPPEVEKWRQRQARAGRVM